MSSQVVYVQSDNTGRNIVLILLAAALIWFVVIPMLKSATAKAVSAVDDAKKACDKAVSSKSAVDMDAAQTAINTAKSLILVATEDEKTKGLKQHSPELVKANEDLLKLSCNTAIATGGAVIPPVVPVSAIVPPVVTPGAPPVVTPGAPPVVTPGAPPVVTPGAPPVVTPAPRAGIDKSNTWSERQSFNNLLCPSGYSVNKVYSAKYTAFDGPECSADVTPAISSVLVGKSGLYAFDQGLNAAVGKDPCPGYGKYLTVNYQCM